MNNPSESTEYDNAKFTEDKPKEDLKIIEHCDTPECPECDIKAYNRGKQDTLSYVVEKVGEIHNALHNRDYDLAYHLTSELCLILQE